VMLERAVKPAADNPRKVFVLTLRPEPGCADPVQALRAMLKSALCRFGLRCTSCEEQRE
jgi:hypothetical protein